MVPPGPSINLLPLLRWFLGPATSTVGPVSSSLCRRSGLNSWSVLIAMVNILLQLAALSTLVATTQPSQHAGPLTTSAQELIRALEEQPPVLPQIYQYPFDHPRRTQMDYLPFIARADQGGVHLGLLSLPQRRIAHRMLRTVLSDEGYLRLQSIRSLEDVLEATEVDAGLARDADAYTLQIFGVPAVDTPWSLKLEGHHISLNATVVAGNTRATPLFLGASPAEIRSGPDAGVRILAAQEDLARALVGSLTVEQSSQAIEQRFEPGETIPVGPLVDLGAPVGLSGADMSVEQRSLLIQLVASYAANLRRELALETLQRLEHHGVETLSFLWKGSLEPGAPFSYWIQGPTVAIQFDMIQDGPGPGANHIHTLWRDPERDFGTDLLREHYERGHAPGRHP